MRWKVWLPIATIAVVVVFGVVMVLLNQRPGPLSLPQEAFPLPPLSTSPYLNTGPDAHHIGIDGCKECHRANYESYLHTAHSRAMSDVDLAAQPPDGAFEHEPSGRSYRVYRDGNQFRHQEVLRTPEGLEIGRVDLPIRYVVGSGEISRSYLIESDGFLAKTPISWYTQERRWDMSPGYEGPAHPGFERQVTAECLVCHTGRVELKPGVSEGITIREQRIGCESCHGPGSLHAARRRANQHPDGDDLTIVNPGKLSRSLQESVCAVCHLQGEAWVDVRGRKIIDYRPGLPLTDYRIHYNYDSGDERLVVVGQLEQMRQSACYQKSKDMSCLTCHDPHLRKKPDDLKAYYRQKCLDCHPSEGCGLEKAERIKKQADDNCNACHMPREDTEITHISSANHRIVRSPGATQKRAPGRQAQADLVPFEDAPGLTETDRKRNLGLAYLMAAFKAPDQAQAFAQGGRARGMLESCLEDGLRDGAILQSLAQIHRRERNLPLARRYAQEALAAKDLPQVARGELLLLVAEGHIVDRDFEAAVSILENLTRERRLSVDWRILGACYLEMKQPDKALQAFEKALSINPYDPRVHAGLAEIYRRQGDLPRAREHEKKAEWLAQNAKS